MLVNYTNFSQVTINLNRVHALVDLINACEKNKVEIKKVIFYQNGFIVTFFGFDGDAILHDGSYGRDWGYWESIGMPWDHNDVSVHSPETLANLLGAVVRGEDWTKYEEE
jgi:hypothetical protein